MKTLFFSIILCSSLNSFGTYTCSEFLNTVTRSKVLEKHGFLSLDHMTNRKNLKAIIQSRALQPADMISGPYQSGLGKGRTQEALFFELNQESGLSPYHTELSLNKSSVFLKFKINIINNEEFSHITSSGWKYGKFNENKNYSPEGDTSLTSFLKSVDSVTGEVVFRGPVSLKQLTSISVHKFSYQKVLAELKNAGITTISGRSLESFVTQHSNPEYPSFTF